MIQILAYPDDVVITGRSLPSIKKAFLKMDVKACKLGLCVNEEKTKIQNFCFGKKEAGALLLTVITV